MKTLTIICIVCAGMLASLYHLEAKTETLTQAIEHQEDADFASLEAKRGEAEALYKKYKAINLANPTEDNRARVLHHFDEWTEIAATTEQVKQRRKILSKQ